METIREERDPREPVEFSVDLAQERTYFERLCDMCYDFWSLSLSYLMGLPYRFFYFLAGGNLWNWALQKGETIKDKALETTDNLKQKVDETSESLKIKAVETADSLRENYDNLSGKTEELKGKALEQVDSIKQKASDLVGNIQTQVQDLKERTVGTYEDLSNKAIEMKDNLTGRVDQMKETVSGKVDEVKEGLNDKVEEVKEQVKDTIEESTSSTGKAEPIESVWNTPSEPIPFTEKVLEAQLHQFPDGDLSKKSFSEVIKEAINEEQIKSTEKKPIEFAIIGGDASSKIIEDPLLNPIASL